MNITREPSGQEKFMYDEGFKDGQNSLKCCGCCQTFNGYRCSSNEREVVSRNCTYDYLCEGDHFTPRGKE